MELEEMKHAWAEVSLQVEKQKKLTDKLIIDMTQQRYESGLNKVRIPEIGGTVICFAWALWIISRLETFGTGYLLTCALFSAAYFLIMPVFSLRALYKMTALPLSSSTYRELLIWYAAGKRRFLMVQQASLYLGVLLMIAFPPVSLRLMNGKVKDFEFSSWIWITLLGLLFFAVVARWVYRYYARTMGKVEDLLKDLEDNS